MSEKIQEYVYMAKLAEQMERFEDMTDYMKKIIDLTQDLKDEERNLLSIAYKNVVGQRRTAWRAIWAYESKEKTKGSHHMEITKYYKSKLEIELNSLCNEVISILEKNLIKKATAESRVFYLKMKADYYRYLAEFSQGDNRTKACEEAGKAYEAALKDAKKELKPTNTIRLGTALNFSVFHYDILGHTNEACMIAKVAYNEAIEECNNLNADQYKDCTTIMQLLKDNMNNWTSETNEEGEENEQN